MITVTLKWPSLQEPGCFSVLEHPHFQGLGTAFLNPGRIDLFPIFKSVSLFFHV